MFRHFSPPRPDGPDYDADAFVSAFLSAARSFTILAFARFRLAAAWTNHSPPVPPVKRRKVLDPAQLLIAVSSRDPPPVSPLSPPKISYFSASVYETGETFFFSSSGYRTLTTYRRFTGLSTIERTTRDRELRGAIKYDC